MTNRRTFLFAALASSLANWRPAREVGAEDGAAHASSIPDVIYIPTPHDVVARILELAEVRKGDVVYDLGCGDGRIVIAAATIYGCRAVGIDIDKLRVQQSRENVRRAHVQSLVRIEHGDLFHVDLKPASVVTLYLHPRYNARLVPQLSPHQPGSRIVSHEFGIPGIKPDLVRQFVSAEDGRKHTLFL
jgi:SAM-dependent methyltransferase